MEPLTFEQIIQKLQEYFENYGVDYSQDVAAFAYRDYDPEEIGLGPIKEVASYGGEDCGSEWYSIQYFENHDVYVRVDGYYQSHYGTEFYNEWDCCSEVRPKQKTITVYE